MYDPADTIAAISTPAGAGGIGIVRISGRAALSIAGKIFSPSRARDLRNFRLHYGYVVEPETLERIDEVLLAVMRAPHSYTREDMVEIHAHGGPVATRKILRGVLDLGARLAEPGEFTRRAFLNGRIDLAQAEAVLAVVQAHTERSLKAAVNQLQGRLSREIGSVQEELLHLFAELEAEIDFPEEDVPCSEAALLSARVTGIRRKVEDLLSLVERGRIYREGIRTAIIGKPNVGKSSLLNALLGEDRAIVTEIPGTTRDRIEEWVNIHGLPLRIIDTAGIRDTSHPLEKLAVERSKKVLDEAELILLVFDLSVPLEEDEIALCRDIARRGARCILVLNKTDLPERANLEPVFSCLPDSPKIRTCLLREEGVQELEMTIQEVIQGEAYAEPETLLGGTLRHRQHLLQAKMHLKDAEEAISRHIPIDLVSLDLRKAWESLGMITGSTVGCELLDEIFSQFCIGK